MAMRTVVYCKPLSGLVKDSDKKDYYEDELNSGNPVFTLQRDIPVEFPRTDLTPEDCAAGYKCEPVNLLYKTTSAEYGSRPPNVHTVPIVFYSRSQKFSDHLGKCGMPRNRGLNCASDKSRVPLH